jgi:AraC family transcriptional regulator
MDRVYDFIQDHLAEDLPIARLAEVAIVSPWWFQRIFLQMTKETPAQFVRRLRIERAANLLLIQKSSSIGSIASDCGFGSAELMTRHFKNRFGHNPTEWRKVNAAPMLRRIGQIPDSNRWSPDKDEQGAEPAKDDILHRDLEGTVSPLRLERRDERRLIYTRHFRGYDAAILDAFERLRNWALPRGLINDRTITVGIGLDNPNVTDAEKCRFLACFTVERTPEIGEGIGTRVIPAGLYATFEFRGHWSELSLVYGKLFYVWLPQSGVEGVSDCEYFEFLTTPVNPWSLHCKITLQVRSL